MGTAYLVLSIWTTSMVHGLWRYVALPDMTTCQRYAEIAARRAAHNTPRFMVACVPATRAAGGGYLDGFLMPGIAPEDNDNDAATR